ncbi:MAG: 3-methylornithyl-N6-L-lysine dehydrogenase PylD [Thermoplasmata archaeon]|nr:3-methylornithyl-N6-L-lysine dehydrogenase PylD [Thermoplasmata archaeon]
MTRLTADIIWGVPDDKLDLDGRLMKATGKTVKGIAMEAAGLEGDDYDFSRFSAAAVPITSGLGIIGGFAKSVDAIVTRLGMRSRVTDATDVAGFAEATRDGADIIMMSDDPVFMAYNTRERAYTDNSWGTAMGYSVCLKNAAGGVEGKDVLVIGAGRVGAWATKILLGWGANVSVVDIVYEKSESLIPLGAKALKDVEKAVSDNTLLLNAAPYIIPGEIIAHGSIVSSPGVPHYFDLEARTRCKAIIHDPLEIGTAVMAVNSAAYTIKKEERA